jgi:predicted DNA-binding protein
MDKKKLIIRARRYCSETTVISLRLPKDMIKVIEDIAATTGRTRNEIMVMSLEYALDNMEIEEK